MAVISETIARTVFGRADTVGSAIVMNKIRRAGEQESLPTALTVVGVAADTDTSVGGSNRRASGVIYVPFAQHYEPRITVAARTSGNPTPLVGALRGVVARVDPQLAIFDAGTASVLTGAVDLPLRIAASLSGLLGVLALILAMMGLYGVLSYLVARRAAEIGVRMALGASGNRIMRLVVGDGMRPIAYGLAIALVLVMPAQLALWPFFRRTASITDDLPVAVLVAVILTAAGILACYVPGRRATRVDPLEALRQL